MAGQAPASQVAAAAGLYAQGKAETARRRLEDWLARPEAAAPAVRLPALRTLLDICLHSRNDACVVGHVQDLVDTAGKELPSNPVMRARLGLDVLYYLSAARLASGLAPATILANGGWDHEIVYDRELYLRRQVLASNVYLRAGDRAGLDRSLGKILSLVAALQAPETARLTVAASLSDVIETLLAAGETERAWGLYRASGAAIARALPPLSVDAGVFALAEANLLQQVGDLAGAGRAAERAAQVFRATELDPAVRRDLLARTLTLKAALGALSGDKAVARAALAEHPFAPFYEGPGRAPASLDEVAYLAARSLVSAFDNAPDPVAAAALQRRPAFRGDPGTMELAAVYGAAGAALAAPPGEARTAKLRALGPKLRELAIRRDAAGDLQRLGVIDHLLVALAVSQIDAARTPAQADTAFTLMQLAGRTGASFDADALATLAQARDELQRRTIHQALRLRARRDRLEREQIQKVAAAMLAPARGGVLKHDVEARRLLRDYDERIADAEARLARDGISLRGPRLVPLAKLQAVLAPDEAALAVAPTVGGLAYMCVRRTGAFQAVAPVDAAQFTLDAKLLQASLTATYAPSEALDAQFPVAAAVRLYGVLVKPFEPCLKPGDRLVWLGGVAQAGAPLAALLPAAPPKQGAGYDLAQADWLVRRHAVAYAGSAGAVVAARRAAGAGADFDFLGVGDPRLDAGIAAGHRLGLAPLPETRDELEASARGFRTTRLLLEDAATERAFRGEMVGAYRYLSFATHGLLREDLQGLADPALVLTPGRSTDVDDDGLLTASEIADMNLRASFVALSACNTANFDFTQAAQDLPALASAFAVAGVPSTLGTLWPVDSETGKQVAVGLFARLREGQGPAAALAEAQRAFLAAPPGRAWLHPRFWAPFVLLGDGGAAPPSGPVDAALSLSGVETLTRGGGEVTALARAPAGVAARFIGGAGADGSLGEGVRLAGAGGEAWRKAGTGVGGSRVLAQLGPVLVAGGQARAASGLMVPTLQAFDAQGAVVKTWRGESLAQVDAVILAAAAAGPDRLVFAVGDTRARGPSRATDPTVRLMQVGPDLLPRPLFDLAVPPGAELWAMTLTPVGDRLLVTYSDRQGRYEAPGRGPFDDYEAETCLRDQTTWAELRDARTGALVASQVLDGVMVMAAAPGPSGGARLAGSRRLGCRGDRQAVVLALDARLQARTLYEDASLGASEALSLAALPDGRLAVAASKENVVDFGGTIGRRDAEGLFDFPHALSTMVLTLDRQGAPSRPRLLDSGGDVIPDALLAGPAGEILLGGMVGGQAAILTLTERR